MLQVKLKTEDLSRFCNLSGLGGPSGLNGQDGFYEWELGGREDLALVDAKVTYLARVPGNTARLPEIWVSLGGKVRAHPSLTTFASILIPYPCTDAIYVHARRMTSRIEKAEEALKTSPKSYDRCPSCDDTTLRFVQERLQILDLEGCIDVEQDHGGPVLECTDCGDTVTFNPEREAATRRRANL